MALFRGEGLPTVEVNAAHWQQTKVRQGRSMIEVPRYVVLHDPTGLTKTTEPAFLLAQRLRSDKAEYGRELRTRSLPTTPDQQDHLGAMIGVLYHYGRDQLQLDFRHTLASPEDVHFFDVDSYKGLFGNSSGITLSDRQYAVRYHPIMGTTAVAAAHHEIIHGLSPTGVILEVDSGTGELEIADSNVLMSYRDEEGGYKSLDEITTALTDFDVRANYWKDHPTLDSMRFPSTSYHELVIIGEELLAKVASGEDIGFEPVFRDLQRGNMLGEKRNLGMFAPHVTERGMQLLKAWEEKDSKEERKEVIDDIVREMDLGGAREKLDDLAAGREVEALGNLSEGSTLRLQGDTLAVIVDNDAIRIVEDVYDGADFTEQDQSGFAFDNVGQMAAPEEITRPEPRRQIEELE